MTATIGGPVATGTAKRPARKRGDGEGSINEVRAGLWRGSMMVGYRPDGRPDRRYVYGKTRDIVQDKLAELRRTVKQGMVVDRRQLTMANLIDQWLEDCVVRNLRAKTLQSYRQIANLYLRPALGRVQLAALRPEHVRRLCADMAHRELSPTTIRYTRSLLHGALRLAVRMELVARNVADSVSPPKRQRIELHPPAPEDVARLLDVAVAGNDRLAALWTVAAYAGCRPGELLALQWRDVEWDPGSVIIRHNLPDLRGVKPSLVAPPKTPHGRRTISVPPEAITALRDHRQRQRQERLLLGPDYQDHFLVFASEVGTPLHPSNVRRAFKRLLERAELPHDIRVYDMRHAHATALLAAGVHPKVASERLGHASVQLTLDTYTHSVKGLDADAAARVQRAIRGVG